MSILGTITSLLPKADVIEDIGSEMTVSLSATVDNAHSLQKCLHQLDVHSDQLGIASYGLYDTTLEEVKKIFLIYYSDVCALLTLYFLVWFYFYLCFGVFFCYLQTNGN